MDRVNFGMVTHAGNSPNKSGKSAAATWISTSKGFFNSGILCRLERLRIRFRLPGTVVEIDARPPQFERRHNFAMFRIKNWKHEKTSGGPFGMKAKMTPFGHAP